MEVISVFGAGPSGLMAAEVLARAGKRVIIHDHKRSAGRKFLLAGRGGLNLTHSEPLPQLLQRYGSARSRLEEAICNFSPDDVRNWAASLGIETFIGSSGRVFPVAMKASPLLRAWLHRLNRLGVLFRPQSPWPGFSTTGGICAFGGASWPETGSDGAWASMFCEAGLALAPFRPSNGRILRAWSPGFVERFAGVPVKNIGLSHGEIKVRGEVMIVHNGLEGGAIYAMSRALRERPDIPLVIDLKPDLSAEALAVKLAAVPKKQSKANRLRKALHLSPVAIQLMRETGADDPKKLILSHHGFEGLRRSISSAGGLSWHEVGNDFQLLQKPGWFVAGEMLDWDAPTGGYLLQACLATGVAAAQGLLVATGQAA